MNEYIVFGRGELAIFALKFLQKNNVLKGFVADLPEPEWQESVVDYCIKNNIEIIEFHNVENYLSNNSIGVSIYFRKIFKIHLINKFKYFVNIHNGPLPKYRGVNPINWALKNNETSHGVTLHHIDEGIDTGDIIDQEIFSIDNNLEVIDVYNLCISAGKKIIQNSILKIDSLPRIVQDDAVSSYYSKNDFDKLGERKSFKR